MSTQLYKVPQAFVETIDANGKKIRALINADQARVNKWSARRSIASITGYASDFINNSSTYLEARIKGGAYDNLRHLTLRMAIAISTSSTVIAPTYKWFKKIDILQDGTDILYTIQGAALEWLLLVSHNAVQQAQLARMVGGDPDDICTQANAKAVGTHIFELPLVASFLRKLDINWRDSKSDLILRFYTTGNIAYAANSSNCSVSNVQIVVDSSNINAKYAQVLGMNTAVDISKAVDSGNYLNWQMLENPNQTITVGSANTIDLSAIRGKVPFLLFIIRPQGYTNASGSNTFYNLGDKSLTTTVGTIDIIDGNGKEQIGEGSPLTSHYVRSELIHQSDSPVLYKKPIYCLQFGASLAKSLDGIMDGFFDFYKNHNFSLQYTPVVSVQEVHTLSGTALAAGHIRLKWRNEISPPIAYNASTGTLASTFNAMKVALSSNTTCSFSAAFSAGTSVVATFTTPEMSVNGDLIEVIVSEATSWTTALTTPGYAGLPSTGTYCTQVVAPIFNRITFEDGMLDNYAL